MRLEVWQQIGIVCGSILAVAGVLLLLARGLRGMWRMARRLTDLITQLETLNDRLDANNARLEAHLSWHADPGGAPAGPTRAKPNSGPQTQRRGR